MRALSKIPSKIESKMKVKNPKTRSKIDSKISASKLGYLNLSIEFPIPVFKSLK